VLKYATTLSTVEKFIKAIKMHALKWRWTETAQFDGISEQRRN
jgi:hypothetical protein